MTGGAWLAEPGGVGSIVGGALAGRVAAARRPLAPRPPLAVRWLPATRRGVVVALVIVALLVSSLFGIYHTPFARSGPHAQPARPLCGDRRSGRRRARRSAERRVQAHRDARAVRAQVAAAPAVLRRPARAHRALARRQHAGHAQPPRDAYRFARGEASASSPTTPTGTPLRTLQLDRPLDFAAVTDHAELFGERTICETRRAARLRLAGVRDLPALAAPGVLPVNGRASRDVALGRYQLLRPERRGLPATAARTPWREIQEAAEAHYDRTPACRFTTFVGYEWTGAPGTQEPAPQRHLPQRRGAGAADELLRGAAARRRSGARCDAAASTRHPAATCSPSRTTRT